MRKLSYVFLTIIVIAAICLSLPYFMGVLAQRKCLELTNTFANLTRAEIKVVNYQRHWFDADATFAIRLRPSGFTGINLEKIDAQLQQWTVTAHILHGPVVIRPSNIKLAQAVIEAAVIPTKEQNVLLQRENAVVPLATILLGINLDGSSSLNVKGAPLAFKSGQVIFNLQGLDVQMIFSSFLDKVTSVVNLAGFDFADANSALHLQGLKLDYDGTRNALDLWLGQRKVILQSFTLKRGADTSLDLSGFSLNSSITEEKHLATIRSSIVLDSGNFNGMNYTKNILEWEATNLDMAVFAKLQHEIKELGDMNEPSMQQGMNVLKYFGLLLNNGVILTVKQASSHTPWGTFLAAGQITSTAAKDANFFALLNDLRSEFTLQMQQPLAQYLLVKYYGQNANSTVSSDEQAKNLLTHWVQSGAIVVDGDSYKTKLKYDKTFFVNDKPISLSVNNETGLRQKKD